MGHVIQVAIMGFLVGFRAIHVIEKKKQLARYNFQIMVGAISSICAISIYVLLFSIF